MNSPLEIRKVRLRGLGGQALYGVPGNGASATRLHLRRIMISRGQLRRPLFAAYPNDRKPREIRGDTQYLLSSPENARRLLAAIESARAGQGVRFSTVEDLRCELGM